MGRVGQPEHAAMGRASCAHCGDVVGVYERGRLMLPDGTALMGSPLAFSDRIGEPGAIVVHEHCFARHEAGGRACRDNGLE